MFILSVPSMVPGPKYVLNKNLLNWKERYSTRHALPLQESDSETEFAGMQFTARISRWGVGVCRSHEGASWGRGRCWTVVWSQ